MHNFKNPKGFALIGIFSVIILILVIAWKTFVHKVVERGLVGKEAGRKESQFILDRAKEKITEVERQMQDREKKILKTMQQ